MAKGPFSSSEFVATEFSTPADKADFGNTFLRFLDADCERNLFTKKFYNRLSMTFGHIAHYDIHGFYGTWFTADRHKAAFVQRTLRWPCHGDPKFTFSDVEYAIQRVVRQRNYLAQYELRASEALRSAEVKELERLEAKYRTPGVAPREDVVQEHTRSAPEDSAQSPGAVPVQASLFSHSPEGASMGYSVYYHGEISITPPLSEDHAAIVLAVSNQEVTDQTRAVFDSIAASIEPDLPGYGGLFALSDDRAFILPEEDESRHGLRLCLRLLIEHFFKPSGYVLNGEISWDGDEPDDRGWIFVKENQIEAMMT